MTLAHVCFERRGQPEPQRLVIGNGRLGHAPTDNMIYRIGSAHLLSWSMIRVVILWSAEHVAGVSTNKGVLGRESR
ncbi:hypothetical protein PISMIDRAFT_685199 [Pisolithus microcarpus 441]|uniref:Uncharacterized protein n=1 Tax=Pisolithus microcarpus 441 TaxID=765257 RepID=A0A0C9ZCA2_9AGAM|nr:hypothetical protein PISMIDRAFT_688753 [Pisolithus microcarpus 441]KIK17593.1 hypothetical protein PISMIDRAFT_685199 [Pisolithus microcarpus 441]